MPRAGPIRLLPRASRALLAAVLVCTSILSAPSAGAQSPEQPEPSAASVPKAGRYMHMSATAGFGDSFRFNNPFRLSNQLGSTGESVSRTPPYADLGGTFLLGQPNGWQYGMAWHWSRALAGVPQHVVTPSFTLLYGGWRPWLAWARAGTPIVVNPDSNLGLEAAVGGAWLALAGLGFHAEVIGDVFYGAATWTTGRTTIPMLSLQAGIIVDYEVLP